MEYNEPTFDIFEELLYYTLRVNVIMVRCAGRARLIRLYSVCPVQATETFPLTNIGHQMPFIASAVLVGFNKKTRLFRHAEEKREVLRENCD